MKESIRFPQGTKLDESNKRIFIPKVGYIRYRKSRLIVGTIKNVTFRLACGKWFVSIQTEYEQTNQIHHCNTEIGIDMGISRFATLSNGDYFEPLDVFKQNQVKLKKLQQQLSHKEKFSKNWIKAKRKVSRHHHRIANTRKDFLHKTSNEISQNHATIYI